jgi:hypothetical protein
VGTEFFQADGQTHMPMQIVAFRNFKNVPKSHGLNIHRRKELCWLQFYT